MKTNASYSNRIPIKAWAEEDRPREKLLHQGRKQLSNAELVAILIGSGNRTESAVSLSQRILAEFDNDLHKFALTDIKRLLSFKGIGEAKAINIIASIELGKRCALEPSAHIEKITSSQDANKILQPILSGLAKEEFWILLLNRANKVISKKQISQGGVSGTVVDAKIVFKEALACLASSIILAHNHPSGNLKPSQADLDLTKKLKQAGKTMDISVLDHLIITDQGYLSFADEGLI